ncbi:hypothetical protein IV203_006409 [Nitzschia inconspicua]|uniref:Uncharacterized protein n=1 Tax=Nitzschia inconspicua TaxID=303405 RepID=A0A9K3KBB9_9STRA|nr:hypothetical protein IV203_006409 [Nitzschia inconspicua]
MSTTAGASFTTLRLLLLLVASVVLAKANAQGTDVCDVDFLSGSGFADYIDCIITNPGCSDCDSTSDTQDDPFGGGSLPSTNNDIETLFCPVVNCCSSCTEQSKALVQCTANTICEAFGIADCSLDCPPDRFPYGDGESVPDECEIAAGAFYSCLFRQGSCLSSSDDDCLAQMNQFDESTTAASIANSCALADQFFCAYVECCPNCRNELQTLLQCEENELAECDLTCASGGNLPPTATATTAPPGETPTTSATPPVESPTTTTSAEVPSSTAFSASGETYRAFLVMAMWAVVSILLY